MNLFSNGSFSEYVRLQLNNMAVGDSAVVDVTGGNIAKARVVISKLKSKHAVVVKTKVNSSGELIVKIIKRLDVEIIELIKTWYQGAQVGESMPAPNGIKYEVMQAEKITGGEIAYIGTGERFVKKIK